jgi:hypothetical protein
MGRQRQRVRERLDVMAAVQDVGSNQNRELMAFGSETVCEAKQAGIEEFEQRDEERTQTKAAAPIFEKLTPFLE